jgi:hypothetical protein
MPTDLDRSRAVCHVCGQRELLPRDAGAVSEELASFSRRHVHRDAFRVDVVVAAGDELPDPYGLPQQRG